MKKIEKVAIVGMGALGLLFGNRIQESLGDNLYFLMDEDRAERHKKDIYRINGEEKTFQIRSLKELEETPDLIIVATKFKDLKSAAELAEKASGPDTIIIALLNGIISEEILAERIPRERILDCVAIGMDAMRDGTSLEYKAMGRLQIGAADWSAELKIATGLGDEMAEGEEEFNRVQAENLKRLAGFFKETQVPYEAPENIRRSMWKKFMMNVGINQACMVYECTYKDALSPGPIYDDLNASMHEVMEIAKAEGIDLTEEDYENGIEIFHTLYPEGYPSMRQDALAGRKSEVDLFAGTVIKIAEKHGIDVPVNRKFYEMVQKMEERLN